MLKRKNSSLTMLLDSTSSMMRNASSTFQCLIGSARRASYCGLPDPSVQLAPNANSGSLYLRSNNANSNDSTLSNLSYDEQRRRVTIYDGRIPQAPMTSTIPFELMTPLEVITKTAHDPVESFVQIVLETPDDQPLTRLFFPSTPMKRTDSPVPSRQRSASPNREPIDQQLTQSPTSNSNQNTSTLPTSLLELFDANQVHCQVPDVIEPMDFSFLEPVLGPDNVPPPVPPRKQSLNSYHHRLRHAQTTAHLKQIETGIEPNGKLRTSPRLSHPTIRLSNNDDRWARTKSSFDDHRKFTRHSNISASTS